MTNLAPYHSFALPYQAMGYQTFNCVEALQQAAQNHALFDKPHLLLGEGSNTVFSCDYDGTIIRLLNQQLAVTEDEHFTYLCVDGGYQWHQLVCWALDNGFYGLENLALIPGTVGAAPIQNIGAYGVQFEDFCQYVEYLDKSTLDIVRLDKSELQFAYRDSLFKGALKDQTVITKVGLKLPKAWRPVLSYGGLEVLGTNCQPRQLFEKVIEIRRSKLPDPAQIPNAGSFFKNPLVSQSLAESLSSTYQNMPKFKAGEHHQKIPAAWLIEQCGLKGAVIGGISIYQQHALIITNQHQGTGSELLELIALVRETVYQKFGIELEPEVRVMGKHQPYSFSGIKA